MYSSVHAVVGCTVGLTVSHLGGSVYAASILSFLSHHYVDHLGESECYGDFDRGVFADTILMTGVISLSAWYAFGWEIAICAYLANGMDFWDKFRSKILNKSEQFPCHSKDHNIILQLTKKQTLFFNLSSTIGFHFFCILSGSL